MSTPMEALLKDLTPQVVEGAGATLAADGDSTIVARIQKNSVTDRTLQDLIQATKAIQHKYELLGGRLGAPLGMVDMNSRGFFRRYAGGAIYWTPTTGAHEVHGAIYAKYQALGEGEGLLGFPLSDEKDSTDHVARLNIFQGGTLIWSPATGAHEVHGMLVNNTDPVDPGKRRQNGIDVQVSMCVRSNSKEDCCKSLPPPAVTPAGP